MFSLYSKGYSFCLQISKNGFCILCLHFQNIIFQSGSDDPLSITWKAMRQSKDLWPRYFNDFCYFKMQLVHTADISLQQDLINSLIKVIGYPPGI